MIDAIQSCIRATDSAVARLYLSCFTERNAVIPFLFHSIFRDESELRQNIVDPLQETTVEQFRQFIEYYLEYGYRFIAPDDLLNELDPNGKYAIITFDDGYANNMLAVPVLKEFNVSATIFISTNHVLQNKCYWWDTLYRELKTRGADAHACYHEALDMKALTSEQIEENLISRFGSDALKPRTDIDRPLTVPELKELASNPLIRLGSHTANHAILVNYGPQAMRDQVVGAIDALEQMTGNRPIAIAYPNGAHNDAVVSICQEAGLKIGFTVRPAKCKLPIDLRSTDLMRIGRFTPHGEAPILSQCRTYRSDLLVYGKFRDGYLRLRRSQASN